MNPEGKGLRLMGKKGGGSGPGVLQGKPDSDMAAEKEPAE